MVVAGPSFAGVIPGKGLAEFTLRGEAFADVSIRCRATGDRWRALARDWPVVVPGLVDLQVNGYRGVDFNSPALTVAEVRQVVEALWREGVTSFCPTIITGSQEQMTASLSTIAAAARADDQVGSALLGAHLEGPWISGVDGARGAHPLEHVQTPSVDDFEALARVGELAILTVAPELVGAEELIRAARSRGVLVSLGHSAAEPIDVRRALTAGATLSTHLGNGVPLTLRRHPNLVWEQLAARRLTAMFIADGHHIDLTTLGVMVRAKGLGRWILVSDTTSLGGLPQGRYRTHIGGQVDLDAAGRLSVVGTNYLAGAALSLRHGLTHALRARIAPPQTVIAAATSRPGKLMRTRVGTRGNLHPEHRADFVIMSLDQGTGDLAPQQTWVRGHRMWSRT